METVKELAKILEECDCKHSAEHCDTCPYIGEEGCLSYFETAKKLVEHGVTIVSDTNVGNKSDWISVDERLPESDARVLVYMHENRMSYTRIDTDRIVKREWVRWGDCVTHWMPIPEAPKGDSYADA